jgi:hypothetical protein
MMRLMAGQFPNAADQSQSPEGSSAAKVLADYAAMSDNTVPINERQRSTAQPDPKVENVERPREIGGRDGPEPTRFGDWEKAGRCIDF